MPFLVGTAGSAVARSAFHILVTPGKVFSWSIQSNTPKPVQVETVVSNRA